jgi:hypothetical protein
MSTHLSIHGETGAELSVTVKDWGHYIAVQVSLGQHSVILYPNYAAGTSVAEQLHGVLELLARPTVEVPKVPVT